MKVEESRKKVELKSTFSRVEKMKVEVDKSTRTFECSTFFRSVHATGLGTWKQNFFQRQACFKNWQHWSSTTIPSIWHLSVGGLRVGPISSTGAYGAMSLLLLILRVK